jgi:hypothetical protein
MDFTERLTEPDELLQLRAQRHLVTPGVIATKCPSFSRILAGNALRDSHSSIDPACCDIAGTCNRDAASQPPIIHGAAGNPVDHPNLVRSSIRKERSRCARDRNSGRPTRASAACYGHINPADRNIASACNGDTSFELTVIDRAAWNTIDDLNLVRGCIREWRFGCALDRRGLSLRGSKAAESDDACARNEAEHPHRFLLAPNHFRVLVIDCVYTRGDHLPCGEIRRRHNNAFSDSVSYDQAFTNLLASNGRA